MDKTDKITEAREVIAKNINWKNAAQFCNGNDPNCKFLEPTEEKQTRKKEPHFCKRFNEILRHYGCHPFIPRLELCKAVATAIHLMDEYLELKTEMNFEHEVAEKEIAKLKARIKELEG